MRALLLLLLFAAATVRAERLPDPRRPDVLDTGPIPARDPFSLSSGFLLVEPTSTRSLEPRTWRLRLVSSVGNDFAQSGAVKDELLLRRSREPLTLDQLRELKPETGDDLFRVDLEHYRTVLAVSRGLGARTELSLSVPIVDIEGGRLDGVIESFHDAFAIGQAGRLGAPKDDVVLYFRAGGEERYLRGESGKGFGDLWIALKHELGPRRDRGGEYALRAVAKLPTGGDEFLASSGSFDLAVQLLAAHRRERSRWHGSVAVTYLGEHDPLDLGDQLHLTGSLGWERRLGAASSLVVQATLSDSPFADLGIPELDRLSALVTVGAKRALGPGQLFLAVTENTSNFNTGSDIGLHFGFERSFGAAFRPLDP